MLYHPQYLAVLWVVESILSVPDFGNLGTDGGAVIVEGFVEGFHRFFQRVATLVKGVESPRRQLQRAVTADLNRIEGVNLPTLLVLVDRANGDQVTNYQRHKRRGGPHLAVGRMAVVELTAVGGQRVDDLNDVLLLSHGLFSLRTWLTEYTMYPIQVKHM